MLKNMLKNILKNMLKNVLREAKGAKPCAEAVCAAI